MQARTTVHPRTPAFAYVLGSLAVLLVVAVLSNTALPLLASDTSAFYALALIGITMCSLGAGPVVTKLGWVHPISLVGIALGVLAVLVVGSVLFGQAAFLSPLGAFIFEDSAALVSTERLAFLLLALIMAVKWAANLGWSLLC